MRPDRDSSGPMEDAAVETNRGSVGVALPPVVPVSPARAPGDGGVQRTDPFIVTEVIEDNTVYLTPGNCTRCAKPLIEFPYVGFGR